MSAYIVKSFRKTPIERRRLYLDYACWLAETEVLTDFQVTVYPYTQDAPLVINAGYPDVEHKKLMMFASGGTPNTNYTVSMVAKTDAGQIKQDNIGIRVTS